MRRRRAPRPSWLAWAGGVLLLAALPAPLCCGNADADVDDAAPMGPAWRRDIVVVKVGGSSITHKAVKESLNQSALDWFARILAAQIHDDFTGPGESGETDGGAVAYNDSDSGAASSSSCPSPPASFDGDAAGAPKSAFIVIHGAGSFGHHTAKEYGLRGQFAPPPALAARTATNATLIDLRPRHDRRRQMEGLARTRLSVQTLHRLVVATLVRRGISAVAVSPCFGVPGIQAHGADDGAAAAAFRGVVFGALRAGLVPVLHGDTCLYGADGAGVLSGDTLMQLLAAAPGDDATATPWRAARAVFLSDVDGVYEQDPRRNPHAQLVRSIRVGATGDIVSQSAMKAATASSHAHDVTGGLKTKLASAAAIAASGINVTIAQCGTESAEQVIRNVADVARATVISMA